MDAAIVIARRKKKMDDEGEKKTRRQQVLKRFKDFFSPRVRWLVRRLVSRY